MRLRYLLSAFFLLCLLSACESGLDSRLESPATGTFALRLRPEGHFVTVNGRTKAAQVATDDFEVSVYNTAGELVQQWPRYADMPAVVSLPAGQYRLQARSAQPLPAAFDAPLYQGEQALQITSGQLSEFSLVCTLANVKVTVAYTDAFLAELTDFAVVVTNGSGNLTFGKDEQRAGYFSVAPLTLHITAIRTLDGTAVQQTVFLDEVAARDHFKITLNAVQTGSLSGGISVDVSTNDKEVDIVVPDEGGTPNPDPTPDPEPTPTAVRIAGVGFDIAQPLQLTDAQAAEATVDVAVSVEDGGIEELWVEIDSPELTEDILAAFNIPIRFDLANLEEGSELETGLKALGLVGDAPVKGQSSYRFSVGAFMALLTAGEGSLDHRFHIEVLGAGQRQQETLTIRRTL